MPYCSPVTALVRLRGRDLPWDFAVGDSLGGLSGDLRGLEPDDLEPDDLEPDELAPDDLEPDEFLDGLRSLDGAGGLGCRPPKSSICSASRPARV